MKNERIRVVIKEPGQDPKRRTIANNLRTLQNIVGGYIETVTISETIVGPKLVIICDEEGVLKGKEFNCRIAGIPFCGTIIAIGAEGEELTDSPVTPYELTLRWLEA